MEVAANDEGNKSRSVAEDHFYPQLETRVHLRNESRHLFKSIRSQIKGKVRKQHNTINTTTSQPYDPGEIFENTIKHQEQTNMSIKSLVSLKSWKK